MSDPEPLPKDPNAPPVDRARLRTVLQRGMGMSTSEARAAAREVTAVFGGRREVRDLDLPHPDRSLLYMLEDLGFATHRREETVDEDGRILRAFWWRLDLPSIPGTPEARPEDPGPVEAAVYDRVPPDAWRSRDP